MHFLCCIVTYIKKLLCFFYCILVVLLEDLNHRHYWVNWRQKFMSNLVVSYFVHSLSLLVLFKFLKYCDVFENEHKVFLLIVYLDHMNIKVLLSFIFKNVIALDVHYFEMDWFKFVFHNKLENIPHWGIVYYLSLSLLLYILIFHFYCLRKPKIYFLVLFYILSTFWRSRITHAMLLVNLK